MQPRQPFKERFAMDVPPKPGMYRPKVISNRCLAILGTVITVAVMAALIGVCVYVTAQASLLKQTDTLTMVLDGMNYNPATFGNPKSKEYKDMKKEFCLTVLVTLSRGEFGKYVKNCNVTGFSKGSLVVHFHLFVQTSGQSLKDVFKVATKLLQQEVLKVDGLFRKYQKNATTATVTMLPASKHTTTSPTAKSVDSNTVVITAAAARTTTTTTTAHPRPPYCEQHINPCLYDGKCVSKGPDDYLCVCPNCGCARDEPNRNCAIDKENVCVNKYLRDEHLIPHPYLCTKFIDCNGDKFSSEDYVWKYEDGTHVFNPHTRKSDFVWNVDCAKIKTVYTCAQVKCENGGTCEDTRTGFKCYCLPHYIGNKCQTYVQLCIDVTCCNGGTCKDTDTGFKCHCRPGYEGENCCKPIEYCADFTCANGGSCFNTSYGFKCHCTKDYTGTYCRTKILDHCVYAKCNLNYTVCKNNPDKDDRFECLCKSCGCSSVVGNAQCTMDPTGAARVCLEARSTPKYSGRDSFYVSHPYNCEWYILCYNQGYIGAMYRCAPPARFNPEYTGDKDNCLDPEDLPRCTETCPGEPGERCPSTRK